MPVDLSRSTPLAPSPEAEAENGQDHAHDMRQASRVLRIAGQVPALVVDELSVEEPLQLRLAGEDVAVLMRTPGHDFDLAAGYLFTEGIISSPDDIASIGRCADEFGALDLNTVNVTPTNPRLLQPERWLRSSQSTSSCGVCGKVSTKQVFRKVEARPSDFVIDLETLYTLTGAMANRQETFGVTGSLHCACLFDQEGNLQELVEDIGRHNAVDKIIGRALIARRLPLDKSVLLVSSRASFEIVQKAAVAGIQVMAAISAPSTLAVDTAREASMTLIGFLRERRLNIYAGEHRVLIGNKPSYLENQP